MSGRRFPPQTFRYHGELGEVDEEGDVVDNLIEITLLGR